MEESEPIPTKEEVIESTVSDDEPDIIGKELELDGRRFVVESVDSHDGVPTNTA